VSPPPFRLPTPTSACRGIQTHTTLLTHTGPGDNSAVSLTSTQQEVLTQLLPNVHPAPTSVVQGSVTSDREMSPLSHLENLADVCPRPPHLPTHTSVLLCPLCPFTHCTSRATQEQEQTRPHPSQTQNRKPVRDRAHAVRQQKAPTSLCSPGPRNSPSRKQEAL
jgi:hypothetical protein